MPADTRRFGLDGALAATAEMGNDPDPEFRVIAIRRILTHSRMDQTTAAAAANAMTDDHDIRDAAYRFLDSSPELP